MDLSRARELLRTYEAMLYAGGRHYEQCERWEKPSPPDTRGQIAHACWMCREALTFDDLDKVQRWLGFVQGVLWATGMRTIDQMRDDNRPPG